MKRRRDALRETEPRLRLGRMPDMTAQIVHVESADDAVSALRERGIGGSAAHSLVQEALVAADGRTDLGAVYRLYALAAAVAAATAFFFASY
jgi:hypothetical protein